MNWTQFLNKEIETIYGTAEKLMGQVDPASLAWKPATGSNWMTVGQLLRHLTDACGAPAKALVTGDWGLPDGRKYEDLPPEELFPTAEKLPSAASVEEARRLLLDDKTLALKMIELAGEENLAGKQVAAPWSPAEPHALGWQIFQMVLHLDRHKSQLFYYLKLQGKPLGTLDLWS
ncbi:MAG: DinB family protein [Terracidiphilus sp.]